MISGDLTFEEEGVWGCLSEDKKTLLSLLVVNQENNEDAQLPTTAPLIRASSHPQQERRLPSCLQDYVFGHGNNPLDGEEVTRYSYFVKYDLINYEEVAKDDRKFGNQEEHHTWVYKSSKREESN